MSDYLSKIVYLTDAQYTTIINNHNATIGGHKYDPTALYITDSNGDAGTVNGHTVESDVPYNAIFTDHYHTTGEWSGMTYTATPVNNAGPLSFTLPSTITATLDGNATSATSAGALTNKSLTTTTINNTAGSYAFSIANTSGMSQITTSNADYVGLQIGDNNDKWQLTAISNSLFFRQNDTGGTNTSWNTWVKILDSGTTNAGTNNNATLTWGTTYTIAKINGTDIKFTTMAKPTYTASDVGLGNVENQALSTWTGTNTIATVGTITSGTWHGTKITNDYIANPKVTIAGNDVSLGGSLTASTLTESLGLSNALHFIGITSTELTNGSTTSTLVAKTTGSLSKTTGFVDGDVVMNGDQLREYVWVGSAWRLLGITTSTAYTLPASVANNTWISSITQNTDGKITATTGTLVTSGTWTGTASKATTTADTTNTLYVVGVTSEDTSTLKHDTSVIVQDGTVSATSYIVDSHVALQYNSTNSALEFVFT